MKLFPIIILLYSLSVAGALQFCKADIYQTELRQPNDDLQVLFIWRQARAGAHNILQLCSNQTGLPIERHCSYNGNDTANVASWDAHDEGSKLINFSLIADHCVEESFEHYFVMKNKVMQKHFNTWKPANIGKLSIPEEACLLETGLPLTRKCFYNPLNYSAQWEEKVFNNTECLREINQDIATFDLDKLYQEVKGNAALNDTKRLEVVTRLTNLLAKPKTVRIATDLEISRSILEIITANVKDPKLLPKVLEVVNLLMQSDDNVVLSSSALGTPKSLVNTVETYLDGMANLLVPTSNCNDVPKGVDYYTGNFTSVFFINPDCSNISGIAVYENISSTVQLSSSMRYDSHTDTYFRYLYLNDSLDKILREPHVEAAVYIPNKVWRNISEETSKHHMKVEALRVSLYRNINFFGDQRNYKSQPASVVLQISLPSYTANLQEFIPFIFQNHQANRTTGQRCANWDYHSWHNTGRVAARFGNRVRCNFWQLKSFGALVGPEIDSRIKTDSVVLTTQMRAGVDVSSIAGCVISLFGLLFIWLKALFFKRWRSQSSSKLLLNICLVLTLIMAYFLFINIPDVPDAGIDMGNRYHRIGMGAFFHYTLLVLFLWILFIAVLQYQRYITVFGAQRPRHYLAKFALAAWSLPIIPVTLVIFLDPESYEALSEKGNNSRVVSCSPGLSLYLTVLLPICSIILANIGIFIYVLCSIRLSLPKFHPTLERRDVIVQVCLSILLFLLLATPWVFGVLTYIRGNVLYSVLFCLTSTLQVLVLFIYCVVIDRSATYSWLKCCCGIDLRTVEDITLPALTRFNFNQR